MALIVRSAGATSPAQLTGALLLESFEGGVQYLRSGPEAEVEQVELASDPPGHKVKKVEEWLVAIPCTVTNLIGADATVAVIRVARPHPDTGVPPCPRLDEQAVIERALLCLPLELPDFKRFVRAADIPAAGHSYYLCHVRYRTKRIKGNN